MKKLLVVITAFFFLSNVFAQEEETTEAETKTETNLTGETFSKTEDFSDFIRSVDFVMQFQPALYLNPESTLVSAPSPIVYQMSIGLLWPNYTFIAVQPTLSFFMMNHLLYEDKALPAEIENRTTTTLSFMINIPAVFSLYLKNSRFQLSAGAGVLMRFGLLAAGVKDSDSGWTGTAGSDVEQINKWFWNDMRWFYINAGGSWLYNLSPQLRAGPVIECSIPVGGLIKDQSPQGMLISLGIKICR